MIRSFASDNNSGVHQSIMNAIIEANINHTIGYGNDDYTRKAIEDFKKIFGNEIDIYFVYNGTGANVISLQSVMQSFNSVICADSAHINVDECGAPEKFNGAKLISCPTIDGKLTIIEIKKHLSIIGDEHHSQPKIISLAQATELGTVYTIAELKEICDFAHQNSLLVHMDGARIANAAVFLDKNLNEITTEIGIDILSFGGTKNGMMFGEAIIFFNKALSKNTKFFRKQAMQLASKMRFISVQFSEILKNNLWKKNAEHANRAAKKLSKILETIPEVKIIYPVETNAIFVKIDKKIIAPLMKESFFYIWDEEKSIVRWMTCFDTRDKDIEKFCNTIKKVISENRTHP